MGLKSDDDKNKKKQSITVIITVILVILTIASVVLLLNYNKKNEDKNFAYTQLLNSINDGTVEKVEMTEGSHIAKIKLINEEKEKNVLIPSTDSFIDLVQEKVNNGSNIELIQKEKNVIVTILKTLLSFLPTIMLVVLLIMIFKMQGLGEKGKIYDSETKKMQTKFDDVAGLDEEKQEMIEIVDFLRNPKKFQEMGAKVPRGGL